MFTFLEFMRSCRLPRDIKKYKVYIGDGIYGTVTEGEFTLVCGNKSYSLKPLNATTDVFTFFSKNADDSIVVLVFDASATTLKSHFFTSSQSGSYTPTFEHVDEYEKALIERCKTCAFC